MEKNRIRQLELTDEQKQTELVDLISEEQREFKDALQFMGLEMIDGEVRIKK
jgi:hypothetical protein